MHGPPLSPLRLRLFNWHKWAGITILALSVLRLGWRWTQPAPPPPGPVARSMAAWQRLAHHGTHAALYVLFFAVPPGWAYSSAAGFPVVWFGVLALPDGAVDRGGAEAWLKPLH